MSFQLNVPKSLPASCAAAFGRPRRAEVLAHVQRARERLTGELSCGAEIDRIAARRQAARERHRVAVDGAGDVARGEIRLMTPAQPVAVLQQLKSVRRLARQELNLHLPRA